MINQFLDILKLIQLELFGLFLVFFVISFYWKVIYKSFALKAYQSKQRLHQDEIPRIGGLIIYLFLTITAFISFDSELLNIILLSAVPIIFIGAKEDLFQNTSPKLRLIFMIVSASLFIYLLPTNLPEIDFPLINQALSFSILKEIFFMFSILVIVNGNNLIDGVNGNLAFTNIIQLISIGLLAFIVGDESLVQLSCLLLLPLIIFTLFNFPFGKIFCGDAGAYFYGFAISASVIYLFGSHRDLLSWNAIILMFYPSFELLFSFIRKKFIDRISPFNADLKHLHSIIYKYLHAKKNNKNNSKTIISLIPFVSAPFITLLFYDSILYISLSLIVLVVIYVFIYLYYVAKVKH